MHTLYRSILILGLIGVLMGGASTPAPIPRPDLSADGALQTLDTIARAGYKVEMVVRMDLIIDPATGLGYWGRLWTAKATRDGVGVSVSGEGFEETVCKLLEGLLN